MTDREVIAWAKHVADVYINEPDLTLSTRYRRLADLAEKATEDWQPIASAPEETDVLVWDAAAEFIMTGWHKGQRWHGTSRMLRPRNPTLWRPLPAPPGGER